MKFFLIIVLGMTLPLFGSSEKTNVISRQEVEQISLSGPQEDSPFLIEREEAQAAAAKAASNPIYGNYLLRPHHSFQKQLKNLAHDLVSLVKIVPARNSLPPLQLFLEPSSFSVADCPELNVTFKITNNKSKIILLDFSTNQRIDIVVKSADGTILSRWSQDRSFDSAPGLVTINPKESVLYTEKISTETMHNGSTYTIETSLAEHPDYSLSTTITPRDTSSNEEVSE